MRDRQTDWRKLIIEWRSELVSELVSEWFILTEGNEPEEGIVTENRGQVAAEASVVGLLRVECIVFFASLLAEFDGRELAGNQV